MAKFIAAAVLAAAGNPLSYVKPTETSKRLKGDAAEAANYACAEISRHATQAVERGWHGKEFANEQGSMHPCVNAVKILEGTGTFSPAWYDAVKAAKRVLSPSFPIVNAKGEAENLSLSPNALYPTVVARLEQWGKEHGVSVGIDEKGKAFVSIECSGSGESGINALRDVRPILQSAKETLGVFANEVRGQTQNKSETKSDFILRVLSRFSEPHVEEPETPVAREAQPAEAVRASVPGAQ